MRVCLLAYTYSMSVYMHVNMYIQQHKHAHAYTRRQVYTDPEVLTDRQSYPHRDMQATSRNLCLTSQAVILNPEPQAFRISEALRHDVHIDSL